MYTHKNGITFRKIERSDLKDLLDLKNESWWGVHTAPILNSEDQERWFESLSIDTICMIAEQENTPVGVLIINHIDWVGRSAAISGSIYKNARGKGITYLAFAAGTDFAFEFLNLHRLNAEVLATNYAAQQLDIGFLGFFIEGVRRQAIYKCGQYYDSLLLGLLRSEWKKQTRIMAYQGSCNTTWDHDVAEKMIDRSIKKFRPGV